MTQSFLWQFQNQKPDLLLLKKILNVCFFLFLNEVIIFKRRQLRPNKESILELS